MADMSHVTNWSVVLALAARPETYFFPVGTNKRPIAGHGGQKRSVRRASEAEADFLREPNALVAIDCAKSNRFTLDCDVAGDSHTGIDPAKPSGVDVIEALYTHHGDDITKERRVRTRSGGLQIHYKQLPGLNDKLGDTAGSLESLVIQAKFKGYVIAEGNTSDTGSWDLIDDVPERYPPEWLLGYVRDKKPLPPHIEQMVQRKGKATDHASVASGQSMAPPMPRVPVVRATMKPTPATAGRATAPILGVIDVQEWAVTISDRKRAEASLRYELDGDPNTGNPGFAQMPQCRCGRGSRMNGIAYHMGRLIQRGLLDQADTEERIQDAAVENGLVDTDGLKTVEANIKRAIEDGKREEREFQELCDPYPWWKFVQQARPTHASGDANEVDEDDEDTKLARSDVDALWGEVHLHVLELVRRDPTLPTILKASRIFAIGVSAGLLNREQVLTSVAATLDAAGFSAGDRQRLNVDIRKTIRDRDYSKRGRILKPGGKTPDPQWIVKDLIMERDLGVLIGASRAGKSTLLTYLMGSVARGTDFLGRPVKKPGGVLTIATELRGLPQARLNVLDPDNKLPVRLVHVPPFGGTDEGWNNMVRLVMIAIADMVLHHDDAPVLINVETLRTSGLIKKDEVSNTDMSNALQRLSALRNITHTAVTVTHHTKKDDKQKFSGADAILTNADSMMTVYKEDEHADDSLRLIRVDKVAEGEPPTLMGFYIKPHETGRIDDEGRPETVGVVEPVNAHLNPPKYLNAVVGIVRELVKCRYADLIKMFQRVHHDLSRTAQYDAVKRAVEFGTKNGLLRIEKADGEKYITINQPVIGLTFNAPLQ